MPVVKRTTGAPAAVLKIADKQGCGLYKSTQTEVYIEMSPAELRASNKSVARASVTRRCGLEDMSATRELDLSLGGYLEMMK